MVGGEAHRRRGEGNISTTDGHGWTRIKKQKRLTRMARMGANLATKDAKSPARPTAATKEADEGRLRMVGTLPVWQEFIMPNKPPAITNNIPNATQGKFCKRWLQARRARSDAPYQRWARDMSMRFHCPLRSSGLTRIFHSHLDRDVNTPMKRGVSTSSDA